MAASTHFLLLLSLTCLLAFGASARPCKTLFVSYTVSTYRPAFQFPVSGSRNPTQVVLFAEFDGVSARPSRYFPSDLFFVGLPQTRRVSERHFLARPLSQALNSLREHSREILSVVAALLFGVCCGAVAAAAAYFVWSFVANNRDDESDDEEKVATDDGYVKLPPSPVKRGVEGC